VASPAQEETARRERKARSDRLSTEFALALIRVNVGPKDEAEAELRKVLAGRAQITAEEPANAEYTSQVVDTHLTLGRLLADADRSEEGFAEVRQATAILEKAAAGPKAVEAGERLAACLLALGGIPWNPGQPPPPPPPRPPPL